LRELLYNRLILAQTLTGIIEKKLRRILLKVQAISAKIFIKNLLAPD